MFAIGDKEWPGLSKLMEEAGEVIQVGGKLMGSRGEVKHWSGDLREKFVEELGDLYAAILFFAEKNLTDIEAEELCDRMMNKYTKFVEWHDKEDPLPEKAVNEEQS